MICNSECKHFIKIKNTDQCGTGICQRSDSFEMVSVNNDCMYEFKPYTCKDCNHYQTNDFACMSAQADDDATNCCGFEDANYVKLVSTLFEWKQRGIDYQAMYDRAVEEMLKI